MYYAMTDIHGEYQKFLQMLDKIHFRETDTLYILGDILDRGPEPARLLQDIAMRDNVYLIKGNHEAMASYILHRLNVEITQDNAENHIDAAFLQAILDWQHNGGEVTMRQFRLLAPADRADFLDYIDDAPLYDIVDIEKRTFMLLHAGLGHFDPDKKLSQYTFDELACMRPDYEKQYFPDASIYIVSGHTPTFAVTGKPEIYQSHNNILLGCGASFPGGRLACLCLDTMETDYV